MEQKPFDFRGLSKEIFSNWKAFFRDNFVFTKVINQNEVSDPIVEAIKDKEIPIVSADEISSPIVDAIYKVQEAIELKEGIEEVSVKNIEQAKTDMTEVVSVLKDIRDKEDISFPEIPEPKDIVKIDGEVKISEPKWWKQADLSETNKTLKEIAKKEFPKFPEFPSFSDIFQKALAPIKEVLDKILSKPEKENPPFEFDEFGRVKVNVDRAGGGGSNAINVMDSSNKIINAATEETLQAIETNQLSGLSIIPWLKTILTKIAYPSWYDPTANVIRNQVQSGTITTVTTVTTVTGLTNIDGYQGKLLLINQNISAWASVVRSRIS